MPLGFSDLPANPFAPSSPGISLGDAGIGGKTGNVFSDLPTNLPGLDLPGIDFGTASKLPDTSGTGDTLIGGVKEYASSGTLARIAAGMIGMIAILAGLFMFRSTQTVITTTGKVAAKAAALVP